MLKCLSTLIFFKTSLKCWHMIFFTNTNRLRTMSQITIRFFAPLSSERITEDLGAKEVYYSYYYKGPNIRFYWVRLLLHRQHLSVFIPMVAWVQYYMLKIHQLIDLLVSFTLLEGRHQINIFTFSLLLRINIFVVV